ncbi:hypothetical protein Fmac_003759 [Flemingia macrophylla]|uniref:Aminoacyl-tRNA synthetase class II (D/K/N) domain-containing protein n=1 Tax=Flemingia macrophylla TaxID=520843 RepID=A0ABD1N323_9FABA
MKILRTDRRPEFTQLDMEMAFTPLEDMLTLNEELIIKKSLTIGTRSGEGTCLKEKNSLHHKGR